MSTKGGKASFRNKSQALPGAATTSVSSVKKKKKNITNDTSKIHSLYQDLYLTDLKNDIGEIEDELSREKEKNLQLNQAL